MRPTHHLDTFTVALTAAAALLLAACGGSAGGGASEPDGGEDDRGADAATLDGSWELASGTGPDGAVPLVASAPVTLVIDGAEWSGTAACNTYGGEAQVDGDRVSLGGFAVTEMACEDPEVMASERAYLDALLVVDRLSLEDDQLVLTGPDTELVLVRQTPPEDAAVVGTRWVLAGLQEGPGPDGVVSSPAAEAELELKEDARLAGSTGCNRMVGGYVLAGDTLELDGPLATTRMACLDDAVGAQERFVLAVWQGGPLRVAVDGDALTLTAADDRALRYTAS
ncbi:MAG: META domain-containing protein [Nitriliruptoraceae bacterium]